ncbi:MAG: hypothetical protein ACRDK2_01085, partial [Solirubrobacteraceae bacterium]
MSCRSSANDPRLTYRCALAWTTHYQTKLQTISCKREYRALLPIGRRERLFDDPLQAHYHLEGIFDCWRDRYAVSGTSNTTTAVTAAPIERNGDARGIIRIHTYRSQETFELPIGPNLPPSVTGGLARRHPEP